MTADPRNPCDEKVIPLRWPREWFSKINGVKLEVSQSKMLIRAVYSVVVILIFALTTYLPVHAQKRIEDRFANVNGVRLHYLIAGKGDPVILLHGYTQTSHMWRPLMIELAKGHTVIAPDLRGIDQSSKPKTGMTRRRWRRIFMRSPIAGISARDYRRSRHRINGRLCLCRAVSPPKSIGLF